MRHGLVLCSTLSLLFSALPALAGPIVSFGLPAYAQLGAVRNEIRSAYQELSISRQQLTATVSNTSLIAGSIASAGSVLNSSSALSDVANFVSTGNTMVSASGAATLGQIGASLTILNFSNITNSLTTLGKQIATLSSQVSNPIDPPTLELYYAVAVSGRARTDATDLRNTAQSGLSSLDPAYRSIDQANDVLTQYAQRLTQAGQLADQLASKINSLMNPATSVLLYPVLLNVLGAQAQIIDLQSTVSNLRSQLPTVRQNVIDRAGDLDVLISSIDYALTAPPLPSEWTTAAYGSLITDKYILDFFGNSFIYPFTEIDGPFLLGTLYITNLISPGTGSTVSDHITFEAQRYVQDPLLGTVTTLGRTDLFMNYVATINSSDPVASADFFRVPSLGISVHIYENETFGVNVFGRYDSPLRIVALEPLAGSTGGFFTTNVPEPRTVTTVVIASILFLLLRPRGEGSGGVGV